MSDTIHVRASSLPLASKCAASLVPPAVAVQSSSESADLGSAVHWLMAEMIQGRYGMMGEALERWPRLDAEELSALYGRARWCWGEVEKWFPDPRTEVELYTHIKPDPGLQLLTLSGHVDVLSITEDDLRLADYKTGWIDADAEEQLRGYGVLALHTFYRPTIRACLIRVRDKSAEWFSWRWEELRDWWNRRSAQLREQSIFAAGPHCQYCRRALECPALEQRLGLAYSVLLEGRRWPAEREQWPSGREDQVVGQLYDAAKMIGALADNIKEAVKARVQASGGRIHLGDGRELAIVEQQRRSIDYQPASEILLETLGLERLTQLVKVSKADVENAVKETAPRGQKGAAVQELMERLERANALRTEVITRLEVKRCDDRITDGSERINADRQLTVDAGEVAGADRPGSPQAADA